MDERAPAGGIRRHRQAIEPLSDDELIARIEGTEPLPDTDDDDPAWLEDATWDRAEFLLAAAEWLYQLGLDETAGSVGSAFWCAREPA